MSHLQRVFFKFAGITVSHFFSMLPSALKYLYSVEPVGMHFPAKQPCTNDTVCNAAMQHCTQYHLYTAVSQKMHSDWFNGIEILKGRWQHGEKVGYCYPSRLEKTFCKWDIYIYILLVTKGLINPLKPKLNPICYLLALLGAHHFLHVSRIRVKLLTFRRLMSYIYMEHPFLMFLDHTQRRNTVGRTPLDE